MLIVVSGLPGTGKSTLAQGIGRALRAPVLSVDPIEDAVLRAGIARSFATGLAAYLVAERLADDQLVLGLAAIVDAVSGVEPARDLWRRLAQRRDVPLRVIECRCSDATLHRERLAARRRDVAAELEPTWDAVVTREYAAWREPVLALDAIAPASANLRAALAWLAP